MYEAVILVNLFMLWRGLVVMYKIHGGLPKWTALAQRMAAEMGALRGMAEVKKGHCLAVFFIMNLLCWLLPWSWFGLKFMLMLMSIVAPMALFEWLFPGDFRAGVRRLPWLKSY